MTITHPATFSAPILELLADVTPAGWARPLLDPFAGTGKIHALGGDTFGVELEPEWAAMHPRTIQGDATALPFAPGSFACVATSPCYGNRFADSHTARDGSLRRSYTHDLRAITGDPDRKLASGSAGSMHWGPKYRALHEAAWAECFRVIAADRWLIVNISDHYRAKELQGVPAWHRSAIERVGFVHVETHLVPTQRLRHGANRERVEHEEVQVYVKPQEDAS